jgi:hypothetical protein
MLFAHGIITFNIFILSLMISNVSVIADQFRGTDQSLKKRVQKDL